jgi:hypothetical protein
MAEQVYFYPRLHDGTFSSWPAYRGDRAYRQFLNYDHMATMMGPAVRRRGAAMDCPICRDLTQAFETGLKEYLEARSSACYQVSKRLAARKNVDMERARYELEEHRRVCGFATRVLVFLPESHLPARLKERAA